MKIWKRVLSILLVLCFVSTALPWTVVPAQAAGGYAVTDLTVGRNRVEVSLIAPEDCLLITALYTEDGAMISSAMEKISGKSGSQTVTVPVDPKGHGSFEAKAFLLNSKTYAPLGETCAADYESPEVLEGFRSPTEETVSFDKDYGIHYVNDTLLAFVELGTPVEQVEEAVSAVNGSIIGRDDLLNLYQIQVETSTLSELKTLADQLEAANPCVSLAVYDTAYPESVSNMTAVPNDPWNGDVSAADWRDTDIDGSNWWIEAVEGQQAWGAADRFAEIPVGVVDSSFDIDHEDLEDQYRFASDGAERRNLTDADSRAHGTHVAGIIGAEADNGVGISGLAQNAELIFSPGASRSDGVIFQAISEAVQAGAKVVNMSQGLCQDLGVGNDTWDEEILQTTATVYASIMAVLLEQGEDFIMVQSAGNGNNRGNTGSEPVDAIQNKWFCSITEETIFVDVEGVTIQDILDHIIIVGNAEQNGSGYRCDYNSNFGSQVDLYAPGTSVYSTFPTESGGYSVQGGTSMAAPVVSAVCALTWGVRPELSGADIRNIVCSATNKTVAPHPDSGCDLSYPLVNARLSVETALQYVAASDGEKQTYPVTVKVRYEDGSPASGVTIDGTGLATAPQTSVDGSVLFFLEEGNYRISANPTGYFDQAVLTINERTTIELTLKKTMFVWALDATGTQLTISGWGPMPDYTTSNMPWGKSITSVSISGVASIGKNAFYNCTALTDVTMDENVTAIGYRAFYGCKNLASAPLPKDLFSLGEKAFYGCTVLDVPAIPEMVTIVEKEAFYNCDAITSVTVPVGVTSFGESVFGHCGALAKAILLPVDAQINKRTFYECTALTSVYAPNGLSVVGVQAFYNCTKLDYIPSLEGVTVIEESAFYNCKALSRVTIPETVTEIENYAFQNCTSLGVAALPEGLTTIGLQVFCNCDSLTSVTIPSTVTSMGTYVFENCANLRSADIRGRITSLQNASFRDCPSLTSVTLPDGLLWMEQNVFKGCTALPGIELPNTLTSIGNHAFNGCSSLAMIQVPDSVTALGTYVFQGCTSLASVTLPKNLGGIPTRTFDGCAALTHLDMPDSVASFGEYAFLNCSSLETFPMPDSLTKVGAYAFSGCSSLLSADLPSGVTSIDDRAYYKCTSLNSLTIPEGVKTIGDYAFAYCESLPKVTIPGSVTYLMYQSAFQYCESLTEVTLCPGVSAVPKWAFAYCDALTTVTIPDTVTSISSNAFYSSNVSVVYYGGSQDQWDKVKNGSISSHATVYCGG